MSNSPESLQVVVVLPNGEIGVRSKAVDKLYTFIERTDISLSALDDGIKEHQFRRHIERGTRKWCQNRLIDTRKATPAPFRKAKHGTGQTNRSTHKRVSNWQKAALDRLAILQQQASVAAAQGSIDQDLGLTPAFPDYETPAQASEVDIAALDLAPSSL